MGVSALEPPLAAECGRLFYAAAQIPADVALWHINGLAIGSAHELVFRAASRMRCAACAPLTHASSRPVLRG
jgi:hypothetical protein